MLTLAVLPIASALATPTITLNPSTGFATTIIGSGFTPLQVICIYWNNTVTPLCTPMITLPYGSLLNTDINGNFIAMTTALEQSSGTYNITATYIAGTKVATATFTVPESLIAGPAGEKGDQGDIGVGAVWFNNSTDPVNTKGVNGDLYLQTVSYNVYQKVSGEWIIIANIKGATGLTGLTGAIGPTGSTGGQGIQGETGLAGSNGADGVIGSIWSSSDTELSDSVGVDNDFYLLTTTNNIYQKIEGIWTFVANISGTKGDVGSPGDNGNMWFSGETEPIEAVTGDLYLNTNTYNVTQKTDEEWVFIANIKGGMGLTGETGAVGPQGVSGYNGTHWYTGTIVPTATTPVSTLGSVNGDLYLRTSTSDIYKKIDGEWALTMNIMGAEGVDGAVGERGLTGATGATGAVGPLGPRGQVGETGAIGAQGIQGIQGVKGEMGDVGATGATGSIGLTGLAGKDADTNMVYLALIMAFIAVLGVAWVYRKQSEYE